MKIIVITQELTDENIHDNNETWNTLTEKQKKAIARKSD